MYAVHTRPVSGRRAVGLRLTTNYDLGETLFAAICIVQNASDDSVARLDVRAYDLDHVHNGTVIYSVEQDTKVDDEDPYYPVIVHRR